MATGITISILQQYFSRLIAKFLNCTSELLIRHDRGGEIVIFRRWQPAEAAWDAKRKDWLKLVYSSRSVAVYFCFFETCVCRRVWKSEPEAAEEEKLWPPVETDCTFVSIWRNYVNRDVIRYNLLSCQRELALIFYNFFLFLCIVLHSCQNRERPFTSADIVKPILFYFFYKMPCGVFTALTHFISYLCFSFYLHKKVRFVIYF